MLIFQDLTGEVLGHWGGFNLQRKPNQAGLPSPSWFDTHHWESTDTPHPLSQSRLVGEGLKGQLSISQPRETPHQSQLEPMDLEFSLPLAIKDAETQTLSRRIKEGRKRTKSWEGFPNGRTTVFLEEGTKQAVAVLLQDLCKTWDNNGGCVYKLVTSLGFSWANKVSRSHSLCIFFWCNQEADHALLVHCSSHWG